MNIYIVYKISIEVQTILKDKNIVINSCKSDIIFMSQPVLAWRRKISSLLFFSPSSLSVYSNVRKCTFVYRVSECMHSVFEKSSHYPI